jgi:hypothetical protein
MKSRQRGRGDKKESRKDTEERGRKINIRETERKRK